MEIWSDVPSRGITTIVTIQPLTAWCGRKMAKSLSPSWWTSWTEKESHLQKVCNLSPCSIVGIDKGNLNIITVKPVFNRHQRDWRKVSFIDRCPFNRGSFMHEMGRKFILKQCLRFWLLWCENYQNSILSPYSCFTKIIDIFLVTKQSASKKIFNKY